MLVYFIEWYIRDWTLCARWLNTSLGRALCAIVLIRRPEPSSLGRNARFGWNALSLAYLRSLDRICKVFRWWRSGYGSWYSLLVSEIDGRASYFLTIMRFLLILLDLLQHRLWCSSYVLTVLIYLGFLIHRALLPSQWRLRMKLRFGQPITTLKDSCYYRVFRSFFSSSTR
jgi:hypothetical protein